MDPDNFITLIRRRLNIYTEFRIIKSIDNSKYFESFGVILYDLIDNSFLIVCKKNTYSFLSILLGRYRPTHLLFYLNTLTKEELNILKDIAIGTFTFDEIINTAFSYVYDIDDKRRRFLDIKNLLLDYYEWIKENNPNHHSNYNRLEWHFPKGKLEKRDETIHMCATRELFEETGIDIRNLNGVEVLNERFEEIIIGTDGRRYKNTYIVLLVNKHSDIPLNSDSSNKEISATKWININEANSFLTSERCRIINDIMGILKRTGRNQP